LVSKTSSASKLFENAQNETSAYNLRVLHRVSNPDRMADFVRQPRDTRRDSLEKGLPEIQDAFQLSEPLQTNVVAGLLKDATDTLPYARIDAEFWWKPSDTAFETAVQLTRKGSSATTESMFTCIAVGADKIPAPVMAVYEKRVAQHRLLSDLYLLTEKSIHECQHEGMRRSHAQPEGTYPYPTSDLDQMKQNCNEGMGRSKTERLRQYVAEVRPVT
jgi:hypothetical protein